MIVCECSKIKNYLCTLKYMNISVTDSPGCKMFVLWREYFVLLCSGVLLMHTAANACTDCIKSGKSVKYSSLAVNSNLNCTILEKDFIMVDWSYASLSRMMHDWAQLYPKYQCSVYQRASLKAIFIADVIFHE